ncbi:MAG: LTA synthase family protein [Phycisphaerales bacterium]|nr:LTA synthase family protein [Phycisphaerales bacterium]
MNQSSRSNESVGADKSATGMLPGIDSEAPQRSLRDRLPRPETLLLVLAFLTTVAAKFLALRELDPESLASAWLSVVARDFVFFGCCFVLSTAARHLIPDRFGARLSLLLAFIILCWSLLDAAWLLYSGVQLQPGILRVIGYSPEEFWPHVRRHLRRRMRLAVPSIGGACLFLGWIFYRVVRPRRVQAAHKRTLAICTITLVALVALTLVQPYLRTHSGLQFSGEVLDHSSHWYALTSFVRPEEMSAQGDRGRQVPRAGQRPVQTPDQLGDLPNIVLVWMESTSHAATSLAEGGGAPTPNLETLAAQGAEFIYTRVPVSQTGKAYWSTLTGTRPDTHYDYSEAILVDEPYENLATILKRFGYRTAFFEMSKGTFQCAPGTFANMGFDWGWWRENLEDPSANLGYLAGDDFRLLDPAFKWATAESSPFLLTTITSVAHDPFVLPKWYGETPKSRDAAYYKTIEYTDAFVGEVLKRIDDLGIADNTIVCVLGDHGESLRPETKRGRWVPYEEVIRIPWLLRWPGHIDPGTQVTWPCSQMDVTPTLLSLLGIGIDDAGFEGRNALTPAEPQRRLYFSSWFEDSPEGFIEGNQKYVYWPYTDRVVVFDLDQDPHELTPRDLEGNAKTNAIADITEWKQASYLYFSPRRFRDRLLFDHWRAFAAGRSAWAYYVPDARRAAE